jgi:chromosome segregation ATPase
MNIPARNDAVAAANAVGESVARVYADNEALHAQAADLRNQLAVANATVDTYGKEISRLKRRLEIFMSAFEGLRSTLPAVKETAFNNARSLDAIIAKTIEAAELKIYGRRPDPQDSDQEVAARPPAALRFLRRES